MAEWSEALVSTPLAKWFEFDPLTDKSADIIIYQRNKQNCYDEYYGVLIIIIMMQDLSFEQFLTIKLYNVKSKSYSNIKLLTF